ncbi:hypothetical protein CPB84DRAFT_1842797 [Gymnopilus junonius]|uniref:Uncharacterized protein n=1 Tax=Gymnopilus junonius TaxID=109634 RepID=A0A9P5NYZ8_GYMJU|nr:hypothetical protein CPB84DRAFT_1842797 [Gymnopilus junonius]
MNPTRQVNATRTDAIPPSSPVPTADDQPAPLQPGTALLLLLGFVFSPLIIWGIILAYLKTKRVIESKRSKKDEEEMEPLRAESPPLALRCNHKKPRQTPTNHSPESLGGAAYTGTHVDE